MQTNKLDSMINELKKEHAYFYDLWKNAGPTESGTLMNKIKDIERKIAELENKNDLIFENNTDNLVKKYYNIGIILFHINDALNKKDLIHFNRLKLFFQASIDELGVKIDISAFKTVSDFVNSIKDFALVLLNKDKKYFYAIQLSVNSFVAYHFIKDYGHIDFNLVYEPLRELSLFETLNEIQNLNNKFNFPIYEESIKKEYLNYFLIWVENTTQKILK